MEDLYSARTKVKSSNFDIKLDSSCDVYVKLEEPDENAFVELCRIGNVVENVTAKIEGINRYNALAMEITFYDRDVMLEFVENVNANIIGYPNVLICKAVLGKNVVVKFRGVHVKISDEAFIGLIEKRYNIKASKSFCYKDVNGFKTNTRIAIFSNEMIESDTFKSFIYIGGRSVMVTYTNQIKTCRQCERPGHMKQSCPQYLNISGSNNQGDLDYQGFSYPPLGGQETAGSSNPRSRFRNQPITTNQSSPPMSSDNSSITTSSNQSSHSMSTIPSFHQLPTPATSATKTSTVPSNQSPTTLATSTMQSNNATSSDQSSRSASTVQLNHATSTIHPNHATSTIHPSHATSSDQSSLATSTVHPSHATSTIHPSHATSTIHPSHATSTIHPSHATSTIHSSPATSYDQSSLVTSTIHPSHATPTIHPSHGTSNVQPIQHPSQDTSTTHTNYPASTIQLTHPLSVIQPRHTTSSISIQSTPPNDTTVCLSTSPISSSCEYLNPNPSPPSLSTSQTSPSEIDHNKKQSSPLPQNASLQPNPPSMKIYASPTISNITSIKDKLEIFENNHLNSNSNPQETHKLKVNFSRTKHLLQPN